MIDDFQGKIVSFSAAGEILAIHNPKFLEIGGRLFLIGTIPNGATEKDSAAGNQCGVAWEDVSDFIIFETEQQYLSFMDKEE